MSTSLVPCTDCGRHFRDNESACPFCGCAPPVATTGTARVKSASRPLNRAAVLFAGATAIASCGTDDSSNGSGDASPDVVANKDGGGGLDGAPAVLYGPVPVDASTDTRTNDGEPAVLYGPVPVDASAQDADEGGPAVLYGPVPVDSGNG